MGGTVAAKKSFLKHVGNRRWRKTGNSTITLRKNYLIYAGNRKWKRKEGAVVISDNRESG